MNTTQSIESKPVTFFILRARTQEKLRQIADLLGGVIETIPCIETEALKPDQDIKSGGIKGVCCESHDDLLHHLHYIERARGQSQVPRFVFFQEFDGMCRSESESNDLQHESTVNSTKMSNNLTPISFLYFSESGDSSLPGRVDFSCNRTSKKGSVIDLSNLASTPDLLIDTEFRITPSFKNMPRVNYRAPGAANRVRNFLYRLIPFLGFEKNFSLRDLSYAQRKYFQSLNELKGGGAFGFSEEQIGSILQRFSEGINIDRIVSESSWDEGLVNVGTDNFYKNVFNVVLAFIEKGSDTRSWQKKTTLTDEQSQQMLKTLGSMKTLPTYIHHNDIRSLAFNLFGIDINQGTAKRWIETFGTNLLTSLQKRTAV